MDEIFAGTSKMLVIVVAVFLVVLFAMIIDLASGLEKARMRGEIRSSWGLKRTLHKFITYEGGVLIAACVDLLMHFSKLLELIGFDLLFGIPWITCLVGVFLCIVEFISVREKADEKIRTEMARVEAGAINVAGKVLSKDEMAEALIAAVIRLQDLQLARQKGGSNENSD